MSKNKKKHYLPNKFLVIALGAFLILVLVSFFKFQNSKLNNYGVTNTNKDGTASLTLVFSKDDSRTFSGTVTDNMTVLDALAVSTTSSNIKVIYSIDKKDKLHLTSINGRINNIGGNVWRFYINGSFISTEQIHKTFVKPGNVLEVRYQ